MKYGKYCTAEQKEFINQWRSSEENRQWAREVKAEFFNSKQALEWKQTKTITKNESCKFVKFNVSKNAKKAYKEIARENPVALVVFMAMVNAKTTNNSVKTSYNNLVQKTGYARSTIALAIKTLKEKNFIAYDEEKEIYVISPSIVWSSYNVYEWNKADIKDIPESMLSELNFKNYIKWDNHASCQRKMVKLFKGNAKAFAAFFLMAINMSSKAVYGSQKAVSFLKKALKCSIRTVYRLIAFLKKQGFLNAVERSLQMNVTVTWNKVKTPEMFRNDVLGILALQDKNRGARLKQRIAIFKDIINL